jgi:hypothetical protein
VHTMFQDLEDRRLMSSPHYVVGPTFTDNGTTLTATGSVAGLGNEDVTVTLDATGTAKIIGINPAGKRAPGQSKVVNVSGETTITDDKNGRVDFSVTTIEPVAPADALPNPKWTAIITDVAFSSATVTVEQGGEVVLSDTVNL